jgi:molybdenum cofactor cytidylyltransferase
VTTAAVVLAAGAGSRSRVVGGAPKPLLELHGRPLVVWALDAARRSGCSPVLLVVGHAGEEVRAFAGDDVQVVDAPRWSEGISHSLRAALDALEPDRSVTAACVGLADQPRIGPEAYRRLARVGAAGADIAVATYAGARRNPVLLARSVWASARLLAGDEGARQLMGTHDVVEVDCTGTGDPVDVDTLDDLRALEERPMFDPDGFPPTPTE